MSNNVLDDFSQMTKSAKSKRFKVKLIYEFDNNFSLPIAGCDEAGRGPLAGPVVCAACIMPVSSNGTAIEGLYDSKQITEKSRNRIYKQIISEAIDYSISVIDCETIDKINILQATKRGMCEAINSLKTPPTIVLVDAMNGLDIKYPYKSIIKGDSTSYSIAAASILAKVTRDRIMMDMHELYPQYGFDSNKGYATQRHIEALKKHGPCPIHRKLFVRNALSEQLMFNI